MGLEQTMRELACTSVHLNKASADMNKLIEAFEAKLKILNIGIEVLVRHPSGEFNLGYVKYSNKEWRIIIELISDDDKAFWLFKDAPRACRVRAISAIPHLLEEINNKAMRMTCDLREAMNNVKTIEEAMNGI